MTEPPAQSSAHGVFEADLHLTTADYREGLLRVPLMRAFYWLALVVVAAAVVLTYVGIESTETEYLVPVGWLPLVVLSFVIGWVPDLFAWRLARTSPFRDGVTVRLDAEQITYSGQWTSLSYQWPLVRRAVETRSRFHLVVGLGLSTAVCTLPKSAFPLEDHAAVRELITTKVGRLRTR